MEDEGMGVTGCGATGTRLQEGVVASHTSPSPRFQVQTNSNALPVHLPPIRARAENGDQSPDEGSGTAYGFQRPVVAQEIHVENQGQLVHRFRRSTAVSDWSHEKKTEPADGENEYRKLKTTVNKLSVRDTEVDEAVRKRTELYFLQGRRYSLPLTYSPTNRRSVLLKRQDSGSEHRASVKSIENSHTGSNISQTSVKKLEIYKQQGRRHSLPQSSRLDGRQRLLDESPHETESLITARCRPTPDTSPCGTEELSSRAESRSNLFPVSEDAEEPDRRVERYIHRGRRFSLPPANCLNNGHSTNIGAANKRVSNINGNLTTRLDTNRPPTPIAGSLHWKQAARLNDNLAKSTESLPNMQPKPPTSLSHSVNRSPYGSPRTDIKLSSTRLKPGEADKKSNQGSSGVTWETMPTHKTFSFVYNDENNMSEMASPPVSGGVVLKSLHVDRRPTEPVSLNEDHPNFTLHYDTDNNNDVYSPEIQTSSQTRGIPPTVEILKDSWRCEDEQEKTFRILKWILDEQSQRTGGIGCQNSNH